MKQAMMTTAAMAVALGAAGQAWSQDEKAERLPKVSIEATAAAPPAGAYEANDPVDSGTSKITRRAIEDRSPGTGDVIETLKILPFANFDSDQGLATQESIQDMRPAKVSISGGQFYDNYFSIDGVGVNSRLDVVDIGNAQDYNEAAGGSAQSIWLDSNLLESVTVRDSNVSARYGGFTGGVVQIETRQPARVFGASVTGGCSNDSLTSFKIPGVVRDALNGVEPEPPNYEKCRVSGSVDLPINDKVRVLLAGGRQQTDMTYYRHANYGGTPFGLKSRTDNAMAKVEVDLAPDLTLRGQVTYSPYTSENSANNSRNAVMTQKGGGLTSKIELLGKRGEADWSLTATYAKARSGRDAPGTLFTWSSTAAYANWCSSTNCVEGSFGDLDQWQEDIGLQARWNQPLFGGDVRLGVDYGHVEARKSRPVDNYAYRTTVADSRIVCSQGDPACIAGDAALTVYSLYKAYDASAEVDTVTAFAEYEVSRGPLTVRAGVRYDHESLISKHNFAPRLSVVYEMPWDVTATVGANRYYSRDFLGYAIKSQYPGNYVYNRTSSIVSGQRVMGAWTLSSHSVSAGLAGSGLAIPYSDELTFALSKPLFGGVARLKGVARETRDQFTAGVEEVQNYVRETNGQTYTYRTTYLGNDGETSYRGLSAEWTRGVGRHTFSLNGSWSKTEDNMGDNTLVDPSDEAEYGDEMVYYKGEVRSLLGVIATNQRLNYAAPGLANADWSADWWKGRIRTNLNARWRSGYDQIEETGATQTVGGVRYAVWDVIRYKAQTTFNANVSALVAKTAYGEARLDVRVTNLFDTLPQTVTASSTSQPYRMGRSFWVGMSYKF
ncbi:hypothetical protein V7S57_19950 [Caulobacter sp. CCNWLY153]|uniref:TonB-dependent receptor plug domain-containing protein n=1 Tax=unclassified Caulobacter TaxID=2648921 RepID=UPI002FF0F7C4